VDGLSDELADLAAGLADDKPEDPKVTPAHSNSGNLRNVGQMNDVKLAKLYSEMEPFANAAEGTKEREGFDWVEAEVQRRG
jgi:hypothetical protein